MEATVRWWLQEAQSASCMTIAPVSVDRGKIYDHKCYGCKRPLRGMKSKTLLETHSPQKCKTERRRKARRKNFILDAFSRAEARFINAASSLAECESAAKQRCRRGKTTHGFFPFLNFI